MFSVYLILHRKTSKNLQKYLKLQKIKMANITEIVQNITEIGINVRSEVKNVLVMHDNA